METIYSTRDAMRVLGKSRNTILRWAKRLDVGRVCGNQRLFRPQDLAAIRERAHDGPGNPNFGRKKISE
jgi:hypothetical protein